MSKLTVDITLSYVEGYDTKWFAEYDPDEITKYGKTASEAVTNLVSYLQAEGILV